MLSTDYTFTGQRVDASASLMYYGARYYDTAIARFIQPDSLIADLYNPQNLNRYSYTLNNPVRYTDPTGHRADCGDDCGEDDEDRTVPKPPAEVKGPDLGDAPSDAGGSGGGGGGGGEVVLVTAAGEVITIWDKAGAWVNGEIDVIIKVGSRVNRVWDSRSPALGSGPNGRSFSPGDVLPPDAATAIRERGLDAIPTVINNAQRGAILEAIKDVPAVLRQSMGGTNPELLIERIDQSLLNVVGYFTLPPKAP
jgi:RHS repeat-associated protein